MRAELSSITLNVRKGRAELWDLIPRCLTPDDAARLAREAREIAKELEAVAKRADLRYDELDKAQWDLLMARFRPLTTVS